MFSAVSQQLHALSAAAAQPADFCSLYPAAPAPAGGTALKLYNEIKKYTKPQNVL